MKNPWTYWLLTGALVASLQWNLRGCVAETADNGTASLDPIRRCTIDPIALDLTSEQSAALETLCLTSCTQADALEERAEQRLRELRDLLKAARVNENELDRLVHEASELREQALAAYVDSILSVRQILDSQQVDALLESCCAIESCRASRAACD